MCCVGSATHLNAGETIPIRLFLGGFDLTPTFRDVNKKFSTRYYLNLVLVDEENRRYFKQQVRIILTLSGCYLRQRRPGNHYIQDTRGMFVSYFTESRLTNPSELNIHMHIPLPTPRKYVALITLYTSILALCIDVQWKCEIAMKLRNNYLTYP